VEPAGGRWEKDSDEVAAGDRGNGALHMDLVAIPAGGKAGTPREKILSKLSSVAAIPTASVELIRLVQDPDASNTRLAQGIEYDPSLTSNILRLANSAYFGYSRAVSTVRDAIFLLGRNEIFQLVVASVVGKMMQHSLRGYILSPGELWDHLMGVGAVSRRLGEALHPRIPAYTFTAGLLHDIGKVVLGTFGEVDPAPILALAEQEQTGLASAERRILGIDHAEVGASLLESWNLPAYLAEVVRWHHEPEKESGQAVVAGLVHVADALCIEAGIGAPASEHLRSHAQAVLSKARLEPQISEKVLDQALSELEGLRDIFRF
jgi:putative nucleotidyltransferase with HDIG domain